MTVDRQASSLAISVLSEGITPVATLAKIITQQHSGRNIDFLGVRSVINQRLDSRLDKWQMLLSLLPTWNSYLPELLDTVDSLVTSLKPKTNK